MNETSIPRIQIHGQGIGEISSDDIHRRAVELARLENRHTPNKADHQRALEELEQVGPPPPPEADESEAPVRKWSESMASSGHRAPKVGFDDDHLSEQLVEEGLAEAERDQRLSAGQLNPPESE